MSNKKKGVGALFDEMAEKWYKLGHHEDYRERHT